MTKTMQLSNGVSMPQLGFGVFQIPTHADAKQATLQAIKAGYRLIDTAAAYMNERGPWVKRFGKVALPVTSCSSRLNYGSKIWAMKRLKRRLMGRWHD